MDQSKKSRPEEPSVAEHVRPSVHQHHVRLDRGQQCWALPAGGWSFWLRAVAALSAFGSGQAKYYTVKVPLKVQNRDEGVKGVEANWLDHMTQHFNNGASLVDGYFHLGGDNATPQTDR
ncbi:hypothetical protein CRUP_003937 [Coryphaenoides rupestris]|nr:hypothetical protein CRUP_003937 [Coryphaenoides rupestris]